MRGAVQLEMGRACYAAGGCPTDYIAAALTGLTCAWLIATVTYAFHHRQFPPLRAKHVPLVTVGTAGSVVWLVAMVVSQGLFKVLGGTFWNSCTLWKVWLGGLLGFGLWISCHVARGFRLYFVFVRKQYPPLSSFWAVVALLVPWLGIALAFELGGALTNDSGRCTAPLRWYVPLAAIHVAYVCLFLGVTLSVRNIHFLFNEYRDQKRTAAALVGFVGVWLILWTAKRAAGDLAQRLQVAVRFTLIVAADVAAALFLWVAVQAPIRRLHWRGNSSDGDESSRADVNVLLGTSEKTLLGTHTNASQGPGEDHTALAMGPILTEKMLEAEHLETLLGFPRFLAAFKEFADSRLAGECVHFYGAVQRRLDARHVASPEARIYAADDIIERFVHVGAPAQINVSSAMRARILRQKDLAAADLFRESCREAMSIMQSNLEKEFHQSPQRAALAAALARETREADQLRLLGISEVSTFEELARLTPPSKRSTLRPPAGSDSVAGDLRNSALEESKSAGQEGFEVEVGVLKPGVLRGAVNQSSNGKAFWEPLDKKTNEAGMAGAAGSNRGPAGSSVSTSPLASQTSANEPLLLGASSANPLARTSEHPEKESPVVEAPLEPPRRHTDPPSSQRGSPSPDRTFDSERNPQQSSPPRRYSEPVTTRSPSPSLVRLASRLAAGTVASVTAGRFGSNKLRGDEESQMGDTLL